MPAHEFVQAAHVPDELVPGADVQVVGVGQLHLAAQVLQVLGGEAPFYGGHGAHVHKGRGLDRAVGRCELPPPGVPLFLFQQLKHSVLT